MSANPLRAGDEALAELSAAIGEEGALSLARSFGGVRLYVPRVIGAHHPICVAIGRAFADRLAVWAGGGSIDIPKQAERRARVLSLHRRGTLTRAAIALETGYSERHVYRLTSESSERHPDLFEEIDTP